MKPRKVEYDMSKMKAYILDLGIMYSDANFAYMGATCATVAQPNAPHRMNCTPTFAVLVDHPEAGWILFDTGMGPDPNNWPQHILDLVIVEMPEHMKMENQLALLGLKPSDIKHVLISHMHMDHIGNDYLFADTAEFYVPKDEAGHAFRMVMGSADAAERGWYIKEDVLVSRKKMHYIDRDQELFPGVEVVMLPGHTPCVMGMVLHLDGGTLIFPSDALADHHNYDGKLPGGVYDSISYAESTRKLKEIQKKYNNAQIFFSHDPDMIMNGMKKAPGYYD